MIRLPLLRTPRQAPLDSDGAREWFAYEHANRDARNDHYHRAEGAVVCYCGAKKRRMAEACAKCAKAQGAS